MASGWPRRVRGARQCIDFNGDATRPQVWWLFFAQAVLTEVALLRPTALCQVVAYLNTKHGLALVDLPKSKGQGPGGSHSRRVNEACEVAAWMKHGGFKTHGPGAPPPGQQMGLGWSSGVRECPVTPGGSSCPEGSPVQIGMCRVDSKPSCLWCTCSTRDIVQWCRVKLSDGPGKL